MISKALEERGTSLRNGLKLNPFLANVPILYPITPPPSSENYGFSRVFMGYQIRTLARNGLTFTVLQHPLFSHLDPLALNICS